MSCNCGGDRFFTRPSTESCVEPRRHRDCDRNRFDRDCDRRDHDCDRRHHDRCRDCGFHGCRCNAKSVIHGCCNGSSVGGATLKDGLCAFVNRKVLIRVGCETLCVVIAEVCDCVLKAICPKSGKVLYFNLDRIVDVQDIFS